MAVDEQLKRRPERLTKQEDINPDVIEKIFNHYDDRIRELDKRRIAQQTAVTEGDSDSETITNLVSAINNLITALNASSLTEE